MKATGAQIKDFWENGWTDGYYYEPEDGLNIDNEYGYFALDLFKEYDLLDFGFLCWQEVGEPTILDSEWVEFQDAYALYTKDESVTGIYAVKIPKSYLDDFKLFIQQINGQIL